MATDSIKGTRWSNLPDPTKYDLKEAGKDVRAAGKALNPPEHIRGSALDAVKRAGMRGGTRLGAAGAGAAAALGTGYVVGRGIDNMTGVGKKIVDESGLGDMAEEMATPSDKVELSEESKARIARGDLNEKPKAKASASKESEGGGGGRTARSEAKDKMLMENREPREEAMKRGGMTKKPQYMSFSKTGKPAGMRNVTKMASGGATASSRADGIAQRGKTRGKMC
jgi:hypothetical protein